MKNIRSKETPTYQLAWSEPSLLCLGSTRLTPRYPTESTPAPLIIQGRIHTHAMTHAKILQRMPSAGIFLSQAQRTVSSAARGVQNRRGRCLPRTLLALLADADHLDSLAWFLVFSYRQFLVHLPCASMTRALYRAHRAVVLAAVRTEINLLSWTLGRNRLVPRLVERSLTCWAVEERTGCHPGQRGPECTAWMLGSLPFKVAACPLGFGESGSASAFSIPDDAGADCAHKNEDTAYNDANLGSEGETSLGGSVARVRAGRGSCYVDNLGGED